MSKVVIVTGSRKGIGKELALYYLNMGYVVAGCSRQKGSISHDNYRHFELDVSDEKAVVGMVSSVKKEFGRVDILINNAGVASMNHFITTSVASVQTILNTNFLGTFIFSREVAKVMMKQKNGRIINFTTVATALHLEGEAVYAASKSAVANFTQTIAKELAIYGITVNAIGPTPIETDLIRTVPANKIKDLIAMQAIKRLGDFEDIKNVLDFFLDSKSSFITGQIIYLGGVID